jgi:hypothetical protein
MNALTSIWPHVNPRVEMIHFFHRLTDDYEGHIYELTTNSSEEKYMEK